MSLIYDALRAPSSTEKPAPTYGSVSSGGRLSVRRLRRVRVMWAAGVVFTLGLMVLAWPQAGGAPAPVPAAVAQVLEPAQAEVIAEVNAPPAATTPVQVASQVDIVEPMPALVSAAVIAPRSVRPAVAARSRSETDRAVAAAPTDGAASPSKALTKSVADKAELRAASTSARARDVAKSEALVEPIRVDVGEALIRFNAMVANAEFDQAGSLLDELRDRGLNPLAHSRMLGYLALRAGRLDEARRAYEQVLSRLPGDREASINLAHVDLGQGRASEAEQRLRQLVEVRPDDSRVRALLAQVRSHGRGW